MGICSSNNGYEGQLIFNVSSSQYEFGVYSGSIIYHPYEPKDARYIYVNLIGKESIKHLQSTQQSEVIFMNLLEEKIGMKNQFIFDRRLDNFKKTQSNYCRVQGLSLSTTIYLECYLSKNKCINPQSNEILPNSRRIYLLKVNRQPFQFKMINKLYEPNLPGFQPIVEIQIDRNSFKIGQTLLGTLSIQNTNAFASIIKNQFNIIQIVEIQDKCNHQKKKKLEQIMSSQLLDNLHTETKIIQLEQKIGQVFKDSLSYEGQIYSIKYYVQIILQWEKRDPYIFEELITIQDE